MWLNIYDEKETPKFPIYKSLEIGISSSCPLFPINLQVRIRIPDKRNHILQHGGNFFSLTITTSIVCFQR